jgi:hypothetical protein
MLNILPKQMNKTPLNKIKNFGSSIKNKANAFTNSTKETIKNIGNKINNKLNSNKNTPKVDVIPISKMGQVTIDFLNANTAISKFVSFILFLLLFLILFQMGSWVIQRFFGPQYNPYIINGMVASDKMTIKSSNPNVANSVPIYRSINQNQGLEFTWNVWFFIDSETSNNIFGAPNTTPSTNTNGYRVFSKGPSGDITLNATQDNLNICPGVYLNKNNNDIQLKIVLNTFNETSVNNSYYETITIKQIPIQKWVCCTLRVQNKSVDTYINGMLKNRKTLLSLPKQNYYDTYIGDTNGFKGYISSLRYYAYAVNYDEVQSLFAAGPSLKMISDNSFPASSDYLSIKWFFT